MCLFLQGQAPCFLAFHSRGKPICFDFHSRNREYSYGELHGAS